MADNAERHRDEILALLDNIRRLPASRLTDIVVEEDAERDAIEFLREEFLQERVKIIQGRRAIRNAGNRELPPGSIVEDAPNAGTVRFEPLGANRTKVRLVMAYEPQGAVESAGDALGILSASVQSSVKNFKKYIEEKGVADGAWRGEVHDGVADPNTRRH